MVEFDDVFDGLYRRAYQVAFRTLGDREEAEDIAQEALARAGIRWARLGETTYSEAWVARVAGNLAIDSHRRRRRSDALAPLYPTPSEGEPGSVERVHVRAVLRSLPRRQREVVTLRYLADLPEATVAATLGCSVGSVKKHASRGLAALRSALRDFEERDVRAPR